jgi:hypothetical protein
MVQRDYILRMIEQFAQAIARILAFTNESKFDDARRELDAAYQSLGISRTMVARLDEPSLRLLLRDEKMRGLALLLAAEARLLRAENQGLKASKLEARVAQLGFDAEDLLRRRS